MPTTQNLTEYPNGITAAKAYAKAHGLVGKKGGWIYLADGHTAFAHGWASLTGILVRQGKIRDLDGQSLATREHDRLNGRLRRNVFDQQPVTLVV